MLLSKLEKEGQSVVQSTGIGKDFKNHITLKWSKGGNVLLLMGDVTGLLTQGYYWGRAAVAPSHSMSLQRVDPIGPSGNPHIGRPLGHGGGTGNTASNNHRGARYRRYRMGNSKLNSLPPTTTLKTEKQEQNMLQDPAWGIFVFHSALQLTAQNARIPQ